MISDGHLITIHPLITCDYNPPSNRCEHALHVTSDTPHKSKGETLRRDCKLYTSSNTKNTLHVAMPSSVSDTCCNQVTPAVHVTPFNNHCLHA